MWGFAQIFGPNAFAGHTLIFLIHLVNGALVYVLARLLFAKYNIFDPTNTLALAVSAFFLLWTRSTFAVWWFSAMYDLLVVLFGVLFLIFSFKIENAKSTLQSVLYSLFGITSLLLALRSKEASLLLPFCLVALQIWSKHKSGSRVFFWHQGISVLISVSFLALLISLKLQQPSFFAGSEPYAMSFEFSTLAQNSLRFAYSYLSPFEVGLNFQSFSVKGLAVVAGWGMLTLLTIKQTPRLTAMLISLFASFFLILAPTLPLIHTQSKLYLYFPSVFGSILIVVRLHELCKICMRRMKASRFSSRLGTSKIISRFISKLGKNISSGSLTFLLVLGLTLFARFLPQAQADIRWWLETGKQAKTTWESLGQLGSVKPEDHFIIHGTEGHTHSFLYGPGDVIRLKYMEPNILVELGEEKDSTDSGDVNIRHLYYLPNGEITID